jgi:hypothetical protein
MNAILQTAPAYQYQFCKLQVPEILAILLLDPT